MNRFLSVVMILMALTLAVVPIFTDCLAHGKQLTTQDGRQVPMKCHWAGIAEIGAAIPLGLRGNSLAEKTAQGDAAVPCRRRCRIWRHGDPVPHGLDRGMRESHDGLQPGHVAHIDLGRHRGDRRQRCPVLQRA